VEQQQQIVGLRPTDARHERLAIYANGPAAEERARNTANSGDSG